jgi:type I restriction enzyme S subunit
VDVDDDLSRHSLNSGDLLFSNINSRDEIGKTAIYDGKQPLYHGMNLLRIRYDPSSFSPYFAYYVYDSPMAQDVFFRMSKAAVGQSSINQSQMERLFVPTPPLSEQRKVATVLHTVDQAIQKTEEVIFQLSTSRHGVRQRIFRADGTDRQTEETKVGPITIEIPSDWEIRPIRAFVDNFVGGATLSKDDFTESGISVLPKKAVNETGVATVNNSERQFCSEGTAASNETNLIDSDYLITALRDLNADAPNIGRIVGIEPDSGYPSGEKYLLAQGVHGIQTNSGISDEYLTEISHADWYRRYVKSISVGSTQIHIRNDEFLDIEIPVPPLEEQKEIATTLRDIMRLQSSERTARNQLQRLKQGLMQDLLSGKVRTTDADIDIPEEVAKYG